MGVILVKAIEMEHYDTTSSIDDFLTVEFITQNLGIPRVPASSYSIIHNEECEPIGYVAYSAANPVREDHLIHGVCLTDKYKDAIYVHPQTNEHIPLRAYVVMHVRDDNCVGVYLNTHVDLPIVKGLMDHMSMVPRDVRYTCKGSVFSAMSECRYTDNTDKVFRDVSRDDEDNDVRRHMTSIFVRDLNYPTIWKIFTLFLYQGRNEAYRPHGGDVVIVYHGACKYHRHHDDMDMVTLHTNAMANRITHTTCDEITLNDFQEVFHYYHSNLRLPQYPGSGFFNKVDIFISIVNSSFDMTSIPSELKVASISFVDVPSHIVETGVGYYVKDNMQSIDKLFPIRADKEFQDRMVELAEEYECANR